MSSYVRPAWVDPVFRDLAGEVIHYGSRWGVDGPPPDTYSVDSHPERFAPLQLVADALIEHLAGTYDAQVSWDVAHAGDFLHPPELERVARVTPADPAAAPITVGFTSYPGIVLHAGLLHDFAYPVCGCDACDETALSQAEQLEQDVAAVVGGGYREEYVAGAALPVQFSFRFGDRGQAGSVTADAYPRRLLATAAKRLRGMPQGWAKWPLKSPPGAPVGS